MDFSSRGYQRNNEAAPAASTTSPASPQASGANTAKTSTQKNNGAPKKNKFILGLSVLLAISLLILSILTIIAMATRGSEKSYVNEDKFQAVFLNGGQVYFGNIKTLNSSYLTLGNIFYLNVANSSVQPDSSKTTSSQNITLVKLGCELHGPQDEMVINRDQVQFWENLSDSGKVVKTITEWQKANPNGQKCETATTTNTNPTTTGN